MLLLSDGISLLLLSDGISNLLLMDQSGDEVLVPNPELTLRASAGHTLLPQAYRRNNLTGPKGLA